MNEQTDMTGAGLSPESAAGLPQEPPKSNKTGWILLICGIGCLGLVVLLAIAGLFFGVFYVRASKSVTLAPPMPVVSAGTLGSTSPYAARCHRWTQSGAPAADDAFAKALQDYVFDNHGKQATDDLGEINWFKATSPEQDGTGPGTATVTLSNDAGEQIVLELSWEQDSPGHWTFTADSITGP